MRTNVSSCSTLQGLRVLVIDDDQDSCGFLLFALESYGMEVHAASSACQALKAFVQLQPDVLISDIAMPGEDGYSLIRQVRRLETQQRSLTPAIAVTAIAEKTHEVLSHGFQCLLQKPVDVDELVNEMVILLEQSKLAG
jgi:CheY-like chemotaxis protein